MFCCRQSAVAAAVQHRGFACIPGRMLSPEKPKCYDSLGPFAWHQPCLIGWSPKRTKLRTCSQFKKSQAFTSGSARASLRAAGARKGKRQIQNGSLSVSRLQLLRNCRLQVDLGDLPATSHSWHSPFALCRTSSSYKSGCLYAS